METIFLWCIGIGGIALLAQIVLTMFGLGAEMPDLNLPDTDIGGSELSAGLDLVSVRTIAAAIAVFGAAGLWLDGLLPGVIATAIAVVPAAGAALGAAWLTRLMLKADSTGTLKLEAAVGAVGTVYLAVPAEKTGTGLVQFPLQGRTVEMKAYTSDKQPLASGASVLVVSVDAESERVEVVSTTNLEGLE